jgi:hypothetical protein
MKENQHHHLQPIAVFAAFRSSLCLLFLLLAPAFVEAQTVKMSQAFYDNETLNYDIYFKWGVIMPRAGEASLTMNNTRYNGSSAWIYRLLFRTTGIVERAYRMRDTIDTWMTPSYKMIYSSKRTDEGGYKLIDNLTFRFSGDKAYIHSYRRHLEKVKIDTTLVSDDNVYDILASTLYLRGIDWDNIKSGDVFPFTVAIGRDLVKIHFRYSGKETFDRGSYRFVTRHFYVDIFDKAFTQTKAAAEAWIGDDENHIPVKIRAKLKIGAAEVYFRSGSNLRTTMSSRTAIQ